MTCHPEIEDRLAAFRAARQMPADGVSAQVRAVLCAIHDDLFEPRLNVATIKARCRIRDHSFSCYFKFEVGASIKHYIESLRLEAARALLQDTRISVAEAALAVGYVHLQTFYDAFERRVGSTPGESRRDPSRDLAGLTEGAG
jgi:transcriptional regulator GlxA family with amidase domain